MSPNAQSGPNQSLSVMKHKSDICWLYIEKRQSCPQAPATGDFLRLQRYFEPATQSQKIRKIYLYHADNICIVNDLFLSKFCAQTTLFLGLFTSFAALFAILIGWNARCACVHWNVLLPMRPIFFFTRTMFNISRVFPSDLTVISIACCGKFSEIIGPNDLLKSSTCP